jgi:hypothetical protein
MILVALTLFATYWASQDHLSQRYDFNYKTLAHLKRLGVMFHAYHEKKGHFPPAYLADAEGKKLHSWRVLLLEIEFPELFAKIKLSEPWNSDHNKKLASLIPYFYISPQSVKGERGQQVTTDYSVLVDDISVFPGSEGRALADITTDHASTILIIEVPGFSVHWMEPTDLDAKQFADYFDRNWKSGTVTHRYLPGICMVDTTVKYNRGYSLSEYFNQFVARRGRQIQAGVSR